MRLRWHGYRYYPYERSLALREVGSLLGSFITDSAGEPLVLNRSAAVDAARRLVYFADICSNDRKSLPTIQSLLERVHGNGHGRQTTRYSVHGLHEYKGKFNPQIAKAILNMLGVVAGQIALDPFCGSGTTLVECAHLGVRSVGTDINPLAVFVANAKLKALGIPAQGLQSDVDVVVSRAIRLRAQPGAADERGAYLRSWFNPEILRKIEALRIAIENLSNDQSRSVLLAIASNLLREYSLQEPHDLRIRRRKSKLPRSCFFSAFKEAAYSFCDRLNHAQSILGIFAAESAAILFDCRKLGPISLAGRHSFDVALTSPPYATALPYIDTQRLSLVWLNLIPPSEILGLDAALVGSREIRGENKKQLLGALEENRAALPHAQVDFCIRLQGALTQQDGFRRQVVPRLLYRYFADMADSFFAVRSVMKPNAPFALIVGCNHTVLSGVRFEIDTPAHLVGIAVSRGWRHVETVALQTYQRYGLHMSNATKKESLVILQA